jgi:hypothetical protein
MIKTLKRLFWSRLIVPVAEEKKVAPDAVNRAGDGFNHEGDAIPYLIQPDPGESGPELFKDKLNRSAEKWAKEFKELNPGIVNIEEESSANHELTLEVKEIVPESKYEKIIDEALSGQEHYCKDLQCSLCPVLMNLDNLVQAIMDLEERCRKFETCGSRRRSGTCMGRTEREFLIRERKRLRAIMDSILTVGHGDCALCARKDLLAKSSFDLATDDPFAKLREGGKNKRWTE